MGICPTLKVSPNQETHIMQEQDWRIYRKMMGRKMISSIDLDFTIDVAAGAEAVGEAAGADAAGSAQDVILITSHLTNAIRPDKETSFQSSRSNPKLQIFNYSYTIFKGRPRRDPITPWFRWIFHNHRGLGDLPALLYPPQHISKDRR